MAEQNIGPDYSQRRTNDHVTGMAYAADVVHGGPTPMVIGKPVAADADGILVTQSIATAGETTSFAATYSHANMAKYGRNVTVVASGAATSNVTVHGNDYLGQPMQESLTLNGSTPVNGKKAFKFVTKITWGATAATTINVGWGNGLGLPYCLLEGMLETVNSGVATSGTIALGNTSPQTATSADPRGLWTPHTSASPDGSRELALRGMLKEGDLHGPAHYNG